MSESRGKNMDLEKQWIKRSGVQYRCFSYAFVCPGAFYYTPKLEEGMVASIECGVKIMMDSSAFSFWNFIRKQTGALAKNKKFRTTEEIEKLKIDTVDGYVKFVKKESKKWDFYANFDYVKVSKNIWEMQLELEKRGIHPSPVYHGDSTMDYFKRYCDRGHKVICIGHAPAKRRAWKDHRSFFDRLFKIKESYPEVGLHGFAFTSLNFMLDYPWFSVDSATWVKAAAFGQIILLDTNRSVIHSIHVSSKESVGSKNSYNNMQPSIQKALRSQVEKMGFDFDKIRTDLYERCVFNGYIFSNLETLLKGSSSRRPEWENLL